MPHPRRAHPLLPLTAALGLVAGTALSGAAGAAASTTPSPDPAPGAVADLLPPPEDGRTRVQIGAFNDFHGRLEAPESTDDGEPVGGAAQLAGALDALRAQEEGTVVVSVGDNIGASTFPSFVQQDAPTIAALNAMGVALSAVGNHEFDAGYDDLVERVGVEGRPGPGGEPPLAAFPYLGANVELADGGPAVPEYAVREVSGVSVGFIGVVTAATPSLVAPDGIAGLRFTDPAEAANRVADALSDGDPANGEADVLVLLAHEGSAGTDCAQVATEGDFGRMLQALSPQVDAVLSGHTHQLYDCEVPVPGRELPRPVLSAEAYGVALDRLVLDVDDATGEVVAQAHEVLPVQGFAPDPEVQAIVDAAVEVSQEVGARPVGRITADVTRAFSGAEDDRGTPSPLGYLVADAQLALTSGAGAQIAFMNPGGLRDDLLFAGGEEEDGVVTYAEAAAVQPFANSVVTMTLTGAQVRQVLEEQWQPEGSSRPFLALGVSRGFAFTYDPQAPVGQRVVSVTLDGAELDPAATYRVTVNSFLAAGGDNFSTLAEGTDRVELGQTDLEVLTTYLGLPENQPLTPDTAPRSSVAAAPAPTTPAPAPSPTTPAPVVPAPSPSPSATAKAPVRGASPVRAGGTSRSAGTQRTALPRTGADAWPALAAGGALVLVGGGLLAVSRRRPGTR
ncbi:bifunctional metallophosphatase/5'-nucleotidase [Kineococcus terrestris]|uniref:bifunctional metallophosphatase/5'-nucleotidase n=1 Tax=Kineococcus terrestris TaxID=2044856 RepID=UPI0034DAFB02